MPIVHFLLVYDRAAQRLVHQQPYTVSGEAVAAYEAMEYRYREDKDKEIVLVGADSIESVMVTHGNYFDGVPSASPYLAGV